MHDDRADPELTVTRVGSPAPLAADEALPTTIGDYRILGRLGQGGMGVVYEAEQLSPKRIVALKVIRGSEGTVDESRVAMFRREVEVLARLEHPMISRVYASGRTPEGRHYFAMELVRGASLSDFLGSREKPLDQAELRLRLTILAEIAEAVHYAHQRGVIHRDLKPSNLIVTDGKSDSGSIDSHGGRPRVKILDFGLARITDGDVQATRVTEVATIRGTLPYMSPEQARGRPDEIDLRTDVYALGVLLYEMLTGKLPHDLSSASLVDAVRIIEHSQPKPLKQVWRGAKRLDEDLDTIVRKALEKDADDRYGSAAALAEDIRRYLASQPILARPPSAWYQLRKLVRRNPLPAAFAAALLVLLVGFAGAMTWQARRLAVERDRAQAAAAKATAIQEFLEETLGTSNPYTGGARQMTILDALDRARGRVEKSFANQPIVEAAVRESLGATFLNLGEFDKAEPELRRSAELRIEHLGPHEEDTATAYGQLSRLYHIVGRYDEAIEAANKGIAVQRSVPKANNHRLGERLNDLGFALFFSGKVDEADAPVQEAVAVGRAQPNPTSWFGESLGLRADILSRQGKLDEAVPLAKEALEVYTATLGADNPATDRAKNTLAMIVLQQGKFDEAEKLLIDMVESTKRQLGEQHPDVAVALENLGNVYYRSNRLDKTIEMLNQAAAIRREVFGPNDPLVGRTMANMGTVLWHAGRLEEAEAALREGVKLMRSGPNADHPDVSFAIANLALVLKDRGDRAGEETELRESLRIREKALGDKNQLTAQAGIDLGLQLLSRNVKVAEARTLLENNVTVLAAQVGEDDGKVKAARAALAGGKP